MALIKPPIQLEDIVLSPAQGFWPLAPGWWILIVLVLSLMGWLSYHALKKRLHQRFYRKQHKIIDSLEKYLRNDQLNSQEMFKVLNRILKLYLIHYAKDKTVISLSGNDFKHWVEQRSKINADLNPIFDDTIYQKNIENIDDSNKSSLNAIIQFRVLLQKLNEQFTQIEETAA